MNNITGLDLKDFIEQNSELELLDVKYVFVRLMEMGMKQEDKELLLLDLCARLPHGVKAQVYNHWKDEIQDETITIENLYKLIETFSIGDIKPYLFPLSSMTEEQREEYTDMSYSVTERGWSMANYHQIEWFNKNHFDYRGLIPMGLAIDATNLNVYE